MTFYLPLKASYYKHFQIGVYFWRRKILSICVNPLYTVGLFHSYMLDKSICHFMGVVLSLLLLFYFRWKILLANNVDPAIIVSA